MRYTDSSSEVVKLTTYTIFFKEFMINVDIFYTLYTKSLLPIVVILYFFPED